MPEPFLPPRDSWPDVPRAPAPGRDQSGLPASSRSTAAVLLFLLVTFWAKRYRPPSRPCAREPAMTSSCPMTMTNACFSQYHHGPSTTETAPCDVDSFRVVCWSVPSRSGTPVTVPVIVVAVFRSYPSTTSSPLGAAVLLPPQNASTLWCCRLSINTMQIIIVRPTLSPTARRTDTLPQPGCVPDLTISTGYVPTHLPIKISICLPDAPPLPAATSCRFCTSSGETLDLPHDTTVAGICKAMQQHAVTALFFNITSQFLSRSTEWLQVVSM